MDDLTKRAQEALEGATEGPWQPGEALVGAVVNWNLPASHPNAIVCQEATEGDAFFIAEARQLVPAMLARIEADAARVRSLEEALRPFAALPLDTRPEYHVSVGRTEVERARAALSTPREEGTNWRDDPKAVVEDDEPQTGRGYE